MILKILKKINQFVLMLLDMATVYSPAQARETARGLGEALASSASSYSTLSRALGAQANVRLATVKNLLG